MPEYSRELGTHGGFRVVDLPSAGSQPVSPLLTEYVLTAATEEDRVDIQGDLFPRRSTPNVNFLLGETDGSEMVRHDTRRQERGEIRYSSFGWTKQPHATVRRTFASLVDVRELENATPYDPAGRAAFQAREMVERDTLGAVADIVADEANYGFVRDLTAGSGWDAGGSLANINEAVLKIQQKMGVSRNRLRVALFAGAREAAVVDPEFKASRVYQQGSGSVFPDYPELARYWGVQRVTPYFALEKETKAGDAVETFGNFAVVYYPGDPRRLNSLEGGVAWGGTFEFSAGHALTQYYKPDFTSWCYPWENDEVVLISKVNCAVLIQHPAYPAA